MRSIFCCLVVAVAACKTDNAPALPGPKGDTGSAGLQGMVGPQGPAGPQGAPGGALVNITNITAGSACAMGGIQLVQADGGTNAVCNGAQGAQGQQGTVGPQGAVGPVGPPSPSVMLYGTDGGAIGPIVGESMTAVFVKEAKCVAQVDFQNNRIWVPTTQIYFTDSNCSSSPFVAAGNVFGCYSLGGENYRAAQPVAYGNFMAQSFLASYSTGDGGTTVACTSLSGSNPYLGVKLDSFQMPNLPGPFSFGTP